MIDLALLDRAAIARLIPHQGAMCLLDRVMQCDDGTILAGAPAPSPDHALARDGRLPAIACAEMGLQAMALHGALVDGASQKAGFVSSLGDVEIARPFAGPARFMVAALLASRSPMGFAYQFVVHQGGAVLVRGKATIMFPDGLETPA